MFYHVRLTSYMDFHDTLALDLTIDDLESRFLQPYRQGKAIVAQGKTIPATDIRQIHINRTDVPSLQLMPQIKAEMRSSSIIASGITAEWKVTDCGEDVTDQFITAPPGSEAILQVKPTNGGPGTNKVFVVHGRNDDARRALFSFLRAIGLEPVEWIEAVRATGKSSPYIGEILETAFTQAQAVVILMTPDDEVQLRVEYRRPNDESYESALTPQARPNVLFEAGMAMAYCPDRTILVELGKLRPFSDIHGRYLVRLNNTPEKRRELISYLEGAGCGQIKSGTDWIKEGDFDTCVK